jgi:hypothetical protein
MQYLGLKNGFLIVSDGILPGNLVIHSFKEIFSLVYVSSDSVLIAGIMAGAFPFLIDFIGPE